MKEGQKEKCCCPCHKTRGVFIAAFGLTFLLKNLGVYGDEVNNIVWPAIIVLAGLSYVCSGFCKCCGKCE